MQLKHRNLIVLFGLLGVLLAGCGASEPEGYEPGTEPQSVLDDRKADAPEDKKPDEESPEAQGEQPPATDGEQPSDAGE